MSPSFLHLQDRPCPAKPSMAHRPPMSWLTELERLKAAPAAPDKPKVCQQLGWLPVFPPRESYHFDAPSRHQVTILDIADRTADLSNTGMLMPTSPRSIDCERLPPPLALLLRAVLCFADSMISGYPLATLFRLACLRLGIDPGSLQHLPLEHFLKKNKNPQLAQASLLAAVTAHTNLGPCQPA